MMANLGNKVKMYNIDFSKYNEFLHYDKNIEYFNKDKKEAEKLKVDILELNEDINNNKDIFVNELIEFLK